MVEEKPREAHRQNETSPVTETPHKGRLLANSTDASTEPSKKQIDSSFARSGNTSENKEESKQKMKVLKSLIGQIATQQA